MVVYHLSLFVNIDRVHVQWKLVRRRFSIRLFRICLKVSQRFCIRTKMCRLYKKMTIYGISLNSLDIFGVISKEKCIDYTEK